MPSYVCYLQIPAVDAQVSAAFYKAVFGWEIRGGDEPRFDDGGGRLSGAWVTGRPPSREPGLLPYIWVESIDSAVAKVVEHGGEVIDGPMLDHDPGGEWMAIFRDPAGNVLGLHQPGSDRR